MEIQGKVALVTGGAVRVGKAITLMLAHAGRARRRQLQFVGSAGAGDGSRSRRRWACDALAVQCDVADFGAVRGHGPAGERSLWRCRHPGQRGQPVWQDQGAERGSGERPRDMAQGHTHLDRRRLLRLQPAGAWHAGPWWRRHRQHRRSIGVDPLAGLHGPRRRQSRAAGADAAVGAWSWRPRSASTPSRPAPCCRPMEPAPRSRLPWPSAHCWVAWARRRTSPAPSAT